MSGNMNYSTALFLATDKLRAIRAAYDELPEKFDPLTAATPRQALFKTFDTGISVGDVVVVPCKTDKRHGFTTVKVTQVDVQIDFDSSEEALWVVGKVDFSGFNVNKGKEDQAIALMKKAEELDKRDKLRAKMGKVWDMPEMQALQIVDQSSGGAYEPKPYVPAEAAPEAIRPASASQAYPKKD